MEGPVQPHRHSCTLPFTFRKVEPKIQGSEQGEKLSLSLRLKGLSYVMG
jgi:hypothetical protein